MARPCPDRLPEQVDDVRLCHRRNRFRQRVLYLGVGDVVGVGRQRQYIGRPRVSNRVDLAAIGDCDPGTDDALTAIRRGHTGVAFASSAQARGCVVVKILMIVVVIAIVAGAYWLIRRSVLRDEPASRQRLERRREAWRAGGASGRRRAYTAAATAAAALAAEVATGGGGSDGGGGCGGGGGGD
jgi:hypothetical protein